MWCCDQKWCLFKIVRVRETFLFTSKRDRVVFGIVEGRQPSGAPVIIVRFLYYNLMASVGAFWTRVMGVILRKLAEICLEKYNVCHFEIKPYSRFCYWSVILNCPKVTFGSRKFLFLYLQIPCYFLSISISFIIYCWVSDEIFFSIYIPVRIQTSSNHFIL